jgi:folate-dependent phosphoribosylglycinamide formyltransferase PurN
MIKLAILASGTGSNAENIIRYFDRHPKIQVACVVSNRKEAKVLEKAENLHIEHRTFSKQAFLEENTVVKYLQSRADFIILAGFLLKIPGNLLAAYPNKIINIHPALLPKFGGKGHVWNVRAQSGKRHGRDRNRNYHSLRQRKLRRGSHSLSSQNTCLKKRQSGRHRCKHSQARTDPFPSSD